MRERFVAIGDPMMNTAIRKAAIGNAAVGKAAVGNAAVAAIASELRTRVTR